jgi:hypothetical protein
MSIVNRRNAVLGWVVMAGARRALDRKVKGGKSARSEADAKAAKKAEAKAAKKAEAKEGGSKRRWGAGIAALAALGVGAATYVRSRGRGSRTETLDPVP